MGMPINRANTNRNARKNFVQPALPNLSLVVKTGIRKGSDRQELEGSANHDDQQIPRSPENLSVDDNSSSKFGLLENGVPHKTDEKAMVEDIAHSEDKTSTKSETQSLDEDSTTVISSFKTEESENNAAGSDTQEPNTHPQGQDLPNNSTLTRDNSVQDDHVQDGNESPSILESDPTQLSDKTASVIEDAHFPAIETIGNGQSNIYLPTTPNGFQQPTQPLPLETTPETSSQAISEYSSPVEMKNAPSHTPELNGNETHLPTNGAAEPTKMQKHNKLHMFSLSKHLLHLWQSKQWTDWIIHVESRGIPAFACYGHGAILVRSERLRSSMVNPENSGFGGGIVTLNPLRPILATAFEAALKFLYTDTILTRNNIPTPQSFGNIQAVHEDELEYVISYWIAGIELGVEAVTYHADNLVEDLVHWDTIEIIAKEASYLSLIIEQASLEGSLRLAYKEAAASMLRTVTTFLSKNIAFDKIRLDTTSTPKYFRPRFVQIESPRPSTNPVLASMVFGSMPSHASTSSTSPISETSSPVIAAESTVVSNILLNLDFHTLRNIIEELFYAQGPSAEIFINTVIEERENRRLRIMTNRSIFKKQGRLDAETLELVGKREFMDGHVLLREQVTII